MNDRRVEAKRWFSQAQADMAVVRTLISAGHYATACFHAQQAAEKALKALLFSQGERLVWGHSVRELARQCGGYDQAFTALMADAGFLDQFYIPTRYPNGLPSPAVPSESYTVSQATAAQEASERLLGAVETFLRQRTHVLV